MDKPVKHTVYDLLLDNDQIPEYDLKQITEFLGTTREIPLVSFISQTQELTIVTIDQKPGNRTQQQFAIPSRWLKDDTANLRSIHIIDNFIRGDSLSRKYQGRDIIISNNQVTIGSFQDEYRLYSILKPGQQPRTNVLVSNDAIISAIFDLPRIEN